MDTCMAPQNPTLNVATTYCLHTRGHPGRHSWDTFRKFSTEQLARMAYDATDTLRSVLAERVLESDLVTEKSPNA